MITKVITDKMNAPIDFLRSYRDDKIPVYQGKAEEGELDPKIDEDIKKMKKIKAIADKVGPTLEAIGATITAIKVAKSIAEAAGDAGKIGGALVPPVAAVGVLQDKIIEKVKQEISKAAAAVKNTDFLVDKLKDLAIETIIMLLAIKLAGLKNGAGKDGSGNAGDGTSDSQGIQDEMDALIAESEAGDGTDGQGGPGVTTITTTTTATGTTTTGGVGGGGSSGGGGGY
jgi:hypothetical protein